MGREDSNKEQFLPPQSEKGIFDFFVLILKIEIMMYVKEISLSFFLLTLFLLFFWKKDNRNDFLSFLDE